MSWIKDDASMNAKYCQKSQMMKPVFIQISFKIKEDLKSCGLNALNTMVESKPISLVRKTFKWNRH